MVSKTTKTTENTSVKTANPATKPTAKRTATTAKKRTAAKTGGHKSPVMPLEKQVRAGLRRLAFGDIADTVRLLLTAEAGPDAVKGLDLGNIAELKYGKNGFEVKFFDRFKAMEALARLAENDARAANALPFYEALASGAQEIEGADGNA